MSMATPCIVIAAYNESRMIGAVVAELRAAGYPVVVVDDGSADGTASAAGAAGATVVRHPINLGQGAALQTGIEFALEQGAETIVTFDADGQHRVADIPALCEALATNQADFALGSRVLGASLNAPVSRRILLKLATWFTRLSTRMRVTDTHSGLRAMTKRGAKALKLRQNRMAHASEIVNQLADIQPRWVAHPVEIIYTDYSKSKGQSLLNGVNILAELFVK